MEKATEFILWWDQLHIEDVPYVGGKNASLGEMYSELTQKGVKVPNGFAVTAYAYRFLLEKAGLMQRIKDIMSDLDTHDMENLSEKGHKVRSLIRNAEFPDELKNAIVDAYGHLCKQYGKDTDVAVRSSATAEDLPDASFAGQQETYLNIRGAESLIEACKKCFASLFTNRAISYRVDKKFDHFKIALSIGVQKMVRSDLSCSGVMFSIDTETGFRDAVFITAAYGLGENVVQGAVNPDEYYVHKPTLKLGFRPIFNKEVGAKKIKMIYDLQGSKSTTKNVLVPEDLRRKFVLSDDEVLTLAKWTCIIEEHYSSKAGYFKPMDLEWAKDGKTSELFIVQARPETVMSQKNFNIYEEYVLREKGKILAKGKSVGSKIGQGKARVIKDVKDISLFKKDEVLVTDMTDPDWEPIMKIASAIVTNRGGRTCFTGDTLVLTNKGFMDFKEIYENYEGLMVPSLNRSTLKIEWKPVLAAMKRQGEVIEIETSQTGNMKDNSLKLTKDHKMLTFCGTELVSKEIQNIIKDKEMLLLAQKLPRLNDSSEKDRKLAYLLGAISTDGHVYLTKTHGEVTFIQKPTKEKEEFIKKVEDSMFKVYNKKFSETRKNQSKGFIRGKQVVGQANAYRLYSKQIAAEIKEEKQKIVKTLLTADTNLAFNFLAGVIDGDGCYNNERINIYCSNENLLRAVVVGCLRIGIVPQVSINRNIHNVQIVEKIDEILSYTSRVKGNDKRIRIGTRFFSAKQLFSKRSPGKFSQFISKNLLIDSDKIKNIKDFEGIIGSDTRMTRAKLVKEIGVKDVYNITVADNHNYIVFTKRLSPLLVNNCHAAIISRELGIPCVVGTENGTEQIKQGKNITVSCAEGEDGIIYDGILRFKIEKHDLQKLPRTKTKIMMNVGNPEQALELSFIPNAGIGLAREEFIINSTIKIHPKALINYSKIKDQKIKKQIDELTYGYKDKTEFFIEKLSQGVATLAAAFYPRDVILRFSDFKTNEYSNLIGGKEYEPVEDNPMIGWRGASRYYREGYKDGFALECKAIKKVRDEMGLTNLKVMIPFCRTIGEGKKVLAEMKKNKLEQGKNGLEVYVMCEIPSNVILADQFAEIFDGFSIGSNDLTQLTLGLDRDSAIVADVYDERNEAVKRLIKQVIEVANKKHKKIGICGQAPSDYPEFAQFLVECGINSISLNPDTVIKTTLKIAETEKKLGISPK